MKRLLTLCLFLIGTFSLIAFASISIGRGQPTSKAITYWHLTDCAPPCWAGITPNSTLWSEAVNRVSYLFSDLKMGRPDKNLQVWERYSDLTGERTDIVLSLSGDLVYSFGIGGSVPFKMMPTLGQLVALFGPPSCIDINTESGIPLLFYENASGEVMLRISAEQLSATASVRTIVMNSETNLSCQKMRLVPWRGFRSVKLYLADMTSLK